MISNIYILSVLKSVMRNKLDIFENTLYTRLILILAIGRTTPNIIMTFREESTDLDFQKKAGMSSVTNLLNNLRLYLQKESEWRNVYYTLDIEKLASALKERLKQRAIARIDSLMFPGYLKVAAGQLSGQRYDIERWKKLLDQNCKVNPAELKRLGRFLHGLGIVWCLGYLKPEALLAHYHNFTLCLAKEPHADKRFPFAALYSFAMEQSDDGIIYQALDYLNKLKID